MGRPLGLQEMQAVRIYRKSKHRGSKVVSLTHRLPLPATGTHFCTEFYQNLTASVANTGKFPFARIRKAWLCVIVGFLRKVDEFCALLEVYAA